MSRIGNAPITVPEGVEVNISTENIIDVKGKLGELTQSVHPDIKVSLADGVITLSRNNDDKEYRSMHGLYRSLIYNMSAPVATGALTPVSAGEVAAPPPLPLKTPV